MAANVLSTFGRGFSFVISYHAAIVPILGLWLYVWAIDFYGDIYSASPLLLVALTGIVIYPVWCIEEKKKEEERERQREKLERWWDDARERRRKRRPPISYQAFHNPEDSGDEEEWYLRDKEHGKMGRSKAYQSAKKLFIIWRHAQRENGVKGPFRTSPLSMLEQHGEERIEELLKIAGDSHADCKCGWDAGNLRETTYWNL